MTKAIYIGIADAHGIESIMPESEASVGILSIRADANAHRHAVVYKVELSQTQVGQINKLMQDSKYVLALKYLKRTAKNIEVQRGREKSWNLIPNSDLDPWG